MESTIDIFPPIDHTRVNYLLERNKSTVEFFVNFSGSKSNESNAKIDTII
jgi:hypothetical protein